MIDYLPEVYLAQSLQHKAAEHWGEPGSRTQRLGRRAFRVGGVKPFGGFLFAVLRPIEWR